MKFKAIRKYTVKTIKENEEGKTYEVFTNLKKAREFGIEQRKVNNFVSLTNFKRVSLPL